MKYRNRIPWNNTGAKAGTQGSELLRSFWRQKVQSFERAWFWTDVKLKEKRTEIGGMMHTVLEVGSFLSEAAERWHRLWKQCELRCLLVTNWQQCERLRTNGSCQN